MFYIYCYCNKINNKKYIGQTNNLQRRQYEHKNASINKNHKDYNQLIHKKIREYGLENFDFYVLEEIDSLDLDLIDERETYWIQKLNTFVKNGNGYNITFGGQGTLHKRYLSNEQIEIIINDLLYSKLSQKEIAYKNKVGEGTICNINQGKIYKQKNLEYPLRKNTIDKNIKHAIAEALVEGNMTRQQIADYYGVSLSTVKRIKSGQTKVAGFNFPLKKPVSTIEG